MDAVLEWLEARPDQAAMIHHCGINLGGGTLVDEEFSDYFAARLRRSSVPAEKLCLEITETSVVRDRGARAALHRAHARPRLPVRAGRLRHRLLFVRLPAARWTSITSRSTAASCATWDSRELANAVVRSITDIAHVLDKRTVAEQAETIEQLDVLRGMGVDYAQGYAIRRPQSIESFFAEAPARIDALR